MYSPLSDVVTCPRCGPAYGLVLLADRVEDRRVLEGWFGCSNCREKYRVSGGFCDLAFGPEAGGEAVDASRFNAQQLAAFMGVAEGPALLLVAGAGAEHAGRMADMIEGAEVLAVWSALRDHGERPGVSRFAAGGVLPFRNASVQAVALTDATAAELMEEAARVVAARGRVVVARGSDSDARERLQRAGLRVVAQDERATVAERALF
jgi:hypothetical protein